MDIDEWWWVFWLVVGDSGYCLDGWWWVAMEFFVWRWVLVSDGIIYSNPKTNFNATMTSKINPTSARAFIFFPNFNCGLSND